MWSIFRDLYAGGGGGEEVQVAEAVVFPTSGTECPTSGMGFARLLNENSPLQCRGVWDHRS